MRTSSERSHDAFRLGLRLRDEECVAVTVAVIDFVLDCAAVVVRVAVTDFVLDFVLLGVADVDAVPLSVALGVCVRRVVVGVDVCLVDVGDAVCRDGVEVNVMLAVSVAEAV